MPRASAAFDRLPSESANTREMNRFSNSRVASGNRIPRSTISSTSFCSFSFTPLSSFELEAAQQAERLDVFLAGFRDHLIRQRRHRRLLVPSNRFEIVADELFVEARLRAARCVNIARPETRRVWRQRLVDENDLTFLWTIEDAAELEFCVGNDDAAMLGVSRAA